VCISHVASSVVTGQILLAAFYASVTESKKEARGGEDGLFSLFSLLFVQSYVSTLVLRELQNDTIA